MLGAVLRLLNKAFVLRSVLLAAATIWAATNWQPWRLLPASASETPARVDTAWLRIAPKAVSFARRLLDDYPETIDSLTKARLHAAIAEFEIGRRRGGRLLRFRSRVSKAEMKSGLAEADRMQAAGARKIAAALDQLSSVVRWEQSADNDLETTAPFGNTAVVIRRQEEDLRDPPTFLTRDMQLPGESGLAADLPEGSFFGLIVLNHIPAGTTRRSVTLRSGAGQLVLRIQTSAPPAHSHRFRVLGDDAKATEATVAIYSRNGRLLVPDSALDFSPGGFGYVPTKFRNLENAKYWPGDEGFDRAFFVRGDFEIDLPPGDYRVLASKGPEYLPVDQRLTINGDTDTPHTIRLKRWTDMSSSGWHSGDCHIHYKRLDAAAEERLRLWAQAEDLRMGNILRMGDARETFFPQRAWGKKGRANWPGLSLVPGQEDPRTGVVGHTISLNLPRPVRFEPSYYHYGKVFEEVRRIGGLAGYAHVHDGNFLVDRDMSVSIARGKVDFVEICEFGKIGVDLYYEFLNLGFRLTAAAGSDVPWGARIGATVGDSRVYAYTGRPFDPDEWFDALKNGRTFVTVGPMLDFTVDGRLPGVQLKRDQGDRLKIRATARVGDPLIPFETLEVVVNGEVIRAASRTADQSALEFEVPLTHGLWIAARTTSEDRIGAHTTPVYVAVGNDRHWDRDQVAALAEKRLRGLGEVEALLDAAGEGIGDGRQGNWENVAAFRAGASELRSALAEAREVYQELQGASIAPWPQSRNKTSGDLE
jgi:hypothetical protein